MFKKYALILIIIIFATTLVAQQLTQNVVASGGYSNTKSESYLAYTFGETAIKTLKSRSNVLTEGFHQTHPKITYSGPNLIDAWPNPVTSKSNHKLCLTFYSSEINTYIATLYDISGRSIGFYKYENVQSVEIKEIDFKVFAKGMYFLKVQSENGKIRKPFKIEKL